MVVEYIRYRIPEGRRAEFEEAYAHAAVSLASSPQCVDYELSRSLDEPDCYILRIGWTSVTDHLQGFSEGEHFAAFFAAVKPYVDAIEEMRHYEPTAVQGSGSSVPSLYDWAGGSAALEKLTEAFYVQVANDDLIGPLFAHMDPNHPHHVAMWLCEVLGGPANYSNERGGYAHMLAQHVGRAITEPQRRRWTALLIDSADAVGLPDDPEFRAAFVGYIEWGTRLAVQNSQPTAEPIESAPVPLWGWGIAPPYRG